MKTIVYVIPLGLMLLILPVHAAPTVQLDLGPKTVYGFPACLGRTDDSVTLLVRDKGKALTHYYFCSSSMASVKIETDLIGNNYILLEFGTGHGTNALSGYLMVAGLPQKFDGTVNTLYWYLRTNISGAAGADSRWTYDYRIEKPKCGGLRLVFTRVIEGAKGEIISMPAEKTRVIEVGVSAVCPPQH